MKVRDALHVGPGSTVEFQFNHVGDVVLRKAGGKASSKVTVKCGRFDKVRGIAQIKWRTDELMELLRT